MNVADTSLHTYVYLNFAKLHSARPNTRIRSSAILALLYSQIH